MKFKFLLALGLLVSGFASAQQTVTVGGRDLPKEPLYIEFNGGVNYSLNEFIDQTPLDHNWTLNHHALGAGGFVAVGKEFTKVFGWRLSANYNRQKGATGYDPAERGVYGSSYVTTTSPNYRPGLATYYTFNDAALFADLTVDLMDLFAPNRSNRAFDLKGLVGIGGSYVWGLPDDQKLWNNVGHNKKYSDENGLHWGYRGALKIGYWVSPKVKIGAEVGATFMDDYFTGYKDNDQPFDLRLNAGVGITYSFGKKELAPVVEEPVVVEPEPIVFTPVLAFTAPQKEDVKRRVLEGSAYLDFPVNKVVIYPDYRKNPAELAKIRQTIDVVKEDTTVYITAVGIHGYASPEGSYSNNVRLAKGRAEALKNYLLKLYNFDKNIMSVESTPEDWGNLRKAVLNSSYADKETLLSIIDSELQPDPKNDKLKKDCAESYADLLANVYPALRHSDYTVSYDVMDYTLEQAREIIKTKPHLLSQKEMYDVANSYSKGSAEYKYALETAAKLYPNDPTANLNAACMSIENNDLDAAKKYLAKAGSSAEAVHAKGVVEALQGNYDEAKKIFLQSAAAGCKASDEALKMLH